MMKMHPDLLDYDPCTRFSADFTLKIMIFTRFFAVDSQDLDCFCDDFNSKFRKKYR